MTDSDKIIGVLCFLFLTGLIAGGIGGFFIGRQTINENLDAKQIKGEETIKDTIIIYDTIFTTQKADIIKNFEVSETKIF